MSNQFVVDKVMAGILQSIEDLVPLRPPSMNALHLLRDVATQAGRYAELMGSTSTREERKEALDALKRTYDLYERQCLDIMVSWGKK